MRHVGTSVAGTAAALLLAGCSFASPVTTQYDYAPSDGVRVALGDGVSIENLLVLTRGEGREGHLLGALVNDSTESATVEIVLGDDGPAFVFDIGPAEWANFTDAGLTPGDVDVPPGATLPATVAVAGVGPVELVEVPIPVLDGTLPAYARYLRTH